MTKDETRQILKILKINYPQSFARYTDEETFEFLGLWAEAFKNDAVADVAKAIKSIIYEDTREFAPNIGIVKNRMMKKNPIRQKNVGDAWLLVIRNCSCNPHIARDNYDKLPSNIQKALGSFHVLIEIGYMDNDAVGFARKEFERKYKLVLDDEKELLLSGGITRMQIALNSGLEPTESEISEAQKLLGNGGN